MNLGPLPTSDTPFMRRVRVHQAWYRSAVLRVPRYGTLALSGQPCGSVLPEDAVRRNMNFVGSDALARYLDRRRKGWGVDPVRCTAYMTSSQTLSFNMLAQVVSREIRCARMFNRLLDRTDLVSLESSTFEFAAQGTHYSLGDKTLVDVLLRFRTSEGHLQVIALETKLADRFSTRRTSASGGAKYVTVGEASNLWRDLASSIADNRTRQLTRCHALAQSVQLLDCEGPARLASLVVLTHPKDVTGAQCAARYSAQVVDGSMAHRSWEEFLSAARATNAMDDEIADELSRRYVDLTWSEAAWLDLDQLTVSSAEGSV